jgi:bile acid-coenzyme A ligase
MADAPVPDDLVHIGDRVAELAAAHPLREQVLFINSRGEKASLTSAELERRANAAARALSRHGVREGSVIAIALPTGFDHVTATLGAWKLGATVVPLNPDAGEREQRMLKEAIGGVVLARDGSGDIPLEAVRAETDGSPFPAIGEPRAASVSGGSTGAPRIIVQRRPWMLPRNDILPTYGEDTGQRIGQVHLVVLPLFHAGFTALYHGLSADHQVILLERFTPRRFFETIERYRVQYLRIVPSYMRMALEAPDIGAYDLTSVEAVNHGAAACPDAVKRRWMDIFGAERIYEDYSSMERVGQARWITMIRGDEWLEHPGSVGRPVSCEVAILDDAGRPLPAGTVGLVYVRSPGARQPEYLGDGAPILEHGGFFSVGDLGYLDGEGYLYLVDRKANVVNVGGVDVYPREVEAALLEHPQVADAVVYGVPHGYLGNALHATVVPRDPGNPPEADALGRHCRSLLSAPKVPFSFELRDDIGRLVTGKLRRHDLA